MKTINYYLVKNFVKLIYVCVLMLVLGCSGKNSEDNFITTKSGLQYQILKKGTGDFAQKGEEVLIHETTKYTNDSLVFSSQNLSNPIKILLGGNQVVQGVDEGIQGMQKGEIRKLIVPPSLSKRMGNITFPHPDSTLVYEIELIDVVTKKNKEEGQKEEMIAIDTQKSIIHWTGYNTLKFNRHYGTVKLKNGQWITTNGMITGGEFYIDMNSITNTDGKYNEMLVDHLKNEDFFEVEVYPLSKLQINKVDNSTYPEVDIQANLTIKGITQPIELKGVFEVQNGDTVFTAKMIINRTRWNIKYGSGSFYDNLGDDIISDDIEFNVSIFFE